MTILGISKISAIAEAPWIKKSAHLNNTAKAITRTAK
jgi:hypothetical protein